LSIKKPRIGFPVLYYIPSLGGAERSQQNYFSALSDSYQIDVICFFVANGKFAQKRVFDQDGVNIVQTPSRYDVAVRGYIDKYKPDILATQLIGSNDLVNIAYEKGIPTVCFVHGVLEDVCANVIKRFCPHTAVETCPHLEGCPNQRVLDLHRIKYNKCDVIVCNSEFTHRMMLKFFPECVDKMILVYPNFDYDSFQHKKERVNKSGVIEVFASNSHILKGSESVVALSKRHRNLHFNFVGCHGHYDQVYGRMRGIDAYKHVSKSKMVDLYRKADVTIVPTHLEETFCGVAAESILSGTPVIASNNGNLSDIVKDGVSGHLMEGFFMEQWYDRIVEYSKKVVDEDYVKELRERIDSRHGIATLKETFNQLIGVGL